MGKNIVLYKAILTGLIGGLVFSLLAVGMNYFNLMEVAPKTYLKIVHLNKVWISKWYGLLFLMSLYGLMSTLIACLYYLLFRKVKGLWMGVAFGLLVWGLIFLIIPYAFTDLPDVFALSKRSIISLLCLFILYGLFVGYSISFDYNEITEAE